jgi:hypothetical protein
LRSASPVLKAKAWWQSKAGAGISGRSRARDGKSAALPLFPKGHARIIVPRRDEEILVRKKRTRQLRHGATTTLWTCLRPKRRGAQNRRSALRATHDYLQRLRSRALGAKRSLALREFALGVEALERFVRAEPLRHVHECVSGVLALESEPVDPRL